MKTPSRILLLALAGMLVAAPAAFAQRQLGKKKGPTSKMYLAETQGDGQIINEGKAHPPRQATAFDAPGTIIETKDGAHQAFVYSNGTGMYVDSNTRVEVDRFVQEPFRPDRNTTEMEPSISQSDIFISRGLVGICTGQMVAGSTMNYATPHSNVNIRGGKIVIQSSPEQSVIYLLEGDATVRGGTRDVGGQVLRAGERAVIRPGPAGQPPSITISPIEAQTIGSMDEKVAVACNAKKSVTFETIEKKAQFGAEGDPAEVVDNANPAKPGESAPAGENTNDGAGDTGTDEEIVARPVVPATPPTNITVSPDRITPPN